MTSIFHFIFGWCVHVLIRLGAFLGISYEDINVWIFCILWPAFTVGLIAIIAYQRSKIRMLSRKNYTGKETEKA